jgi:hypothetical protein
VPSPDSVFGFHRQIYGPGGSRQVDFTLAESNRPIEIVNEPTEFIGNVLLHVRRNGAS